MSHGLIEGAPSKEAMIAKLKAIPAFKDFDDATFAEIAQGLRFLRVEAEQEVYRAGQQADACYLISYGSLKLLKSTMPGKDAVLTFCRVGEIVAAAVMKTLSAYPVTAVATEDSGLIEIPRAVYLERWMTKPHVMRAVQANIIGRMIEFQTDKVISAAPVPQKVASFLFRTLDAQPQGFGSTINIKLTRRDIAERVGTSVETVIRILSAWTQKGWITTEDQHITIHDRAAIEAAVNGQGS